MTMWISTALLAAASLVTLPSGTQLEVRLKSKVSSSTSHPKDKIQAEVITPVLHNGQIIVPAGTLLQGHVTSAHPAASAEERARLEIEFCELPTPGGKIAPLVTQVLSVDNARESVDDKGQIIGILASETLSAQMDRGLAKLGQRSAGLADVLSAIKGAVLKEAETAISYEPGVEIKLQLTKPAQVPTNLPPGPDTKLATITPEDAVIQLVNSQPFQTRAEKPPKPSDLTNLMFIGTQEQLEAAFQQAGWASAAKLNTQSGLETLRAIVELRGYKEAPMSVLLLDSRRPDLNWEKQNNTFAQRHHLRIWRQPVTFQGAPVWVCAATHDIAIEFSPENRTFIHKIDPQIDGERAKVVNDLILTGRVKGLAVVDRPDVPKQSSNATGDSLETDGRMAVLLLQ